MVKSVCNIKLVLRPNERNDEIEEILRKLDNICFPFDRPMQIKDSWWWIAYIKNKPVGFAALKLSKKSSHESTLYRAGVIPKARNNGIHKKLIQARIKFARRIKFKQIFTYTVPHNVESMNALINRGFRFYEPERKSKGRDMMYFKLIL